VSGRIYSSLSIRFTSCADWGSVSAP
jgi:hypothetical protein